MKKLFLHIGAGKTGSSALQNWLNKNHEKLKKQGVHYPVFSQKNIGDYQITSGNGVFLLNILRENALEKLFDSYRKDKYNLLFSSEAFQSLSEDELDLLKEVALNYDYEVVIVMYIRDLYDMLYSSYQQLIKRHSYFNSLEDLVSHIKNMQQFDVLYTYEKVFTDIKVIHYDSYFNVGIEKPFCKIIGIDITLLEAMDKRKVNRSMNVFELELIRNANKIYFDEFGEKNDVFCTHISDALIYENPEKKTEIYYNEKILSILSDKFEKDIDYINQKYFHSSQLKIFQKKNKFLIENLPSIQKEFILMVKQLINFFRIKKFDKIQFDIIGGLYNEARKREDIDIEKAIQILETAKILRPNGEVITKALIEYNNKLLEGH